ncbi:MAG: hypothetical protein KAV83_09400 [Desulfobacterales bacterium]|nr:hypothetical protein [Desulfobacterales bacterium]
MKRFGVIFLVIGVLVGVSYTIYVTFISGTKLNEFTIIGGHGITLGPVRIVKDGASDKTVEIGPVRLCPDMNPVRLLLNLSYGRSLSGAVQAEYEAELLQGKERIWRKSGSVRKGSSKKRGDVKVSKVIKTFDVHEDADYGIRFHLWQRSGTVYSARLILKEQVVRIKPYIIIVSGALALAGLGLIVAGGARKSRDKLDQGGL